MSQDAPSPAVCGLDVLFGLMGAEARPGDVLRLSRADHLRVVQELDTAFRRWDPPELPDGHHRAMLRMPSNIDDCEPATFSSAAIFSHQIVRRDPLDHWLRGESAYLGEARLSVQLGALNVAVQRSLEMRRLVDAGILLLVPEPSQFRMSNPVKDFLAERDGIDFSDDAMDRAEYLNRHDIVPFEVRRDASDLALDEAFAAAVLGDDRARGWRKFYVADDTDPFDEAVAMVDIAGRDVATRLGYAAFADATLLPADRVENMLVDMALRTAKEATIVRTAQLVEGTSVPDLRDLTPSDVLAIRNSVEAFESWRNWLEAATARSYLEASTGFGEPQTNFDHEVTEELRNAMTEATRSAALKRYARGEGSVTATKIAVKTLAGFPVVGDVGGAFARVLGALVRPRPAGYRGVLVRLARRG